IVLANKCDSEEEETIFKLFEEEMGGNFLCLPVSAEFGRGLEELKETIFRELDIVRIYTKEPGKPPDKKTPFVLKRGSDLMDLARQVHKDFADNLKYARIWGEGKYDGQKVQRDHELRDGDIVELHI
ncbi:MAG: TGS domain-containing protein, partial [bacterium]